MAIFYITLTLVFLSSLLARHFSVSIEVSDSSLQAKPNGLLITAVTIILVFVSGLRSNIGDTYMYMHAFTLPTLNWKTIDYSDEFGFYIYQLLLKEISKDPQILIFVSALITNIFIIYTLKKYADFFELSIFVYITSGMFLVSMNGIRQFLAASMIFMGTKFIIKGNFKAYLLTVLIAMTFHKSALILIPVYFIVRRKAWTKGTMLLLLSSILIVIVYNEFSSVLFSVIEDTKYGHYQNFSEGGANVLRVVVVAVPIFLAFIGREKLNKLYPSSDYIINMAVIGLLITIISTQNWIFARFNIYFGLYNLILISWIVPLFLKRDRYFIYYSILVCYFLFFIYEQLISLGINYQSNFFDF